VHPHPAARRRVDEYKTILDLLKETFANGVKIKRLAAALAYYGVSAPLLIIVTHRRLGI